MSIQRQKGRLRRLAHRAGAALTMVAASHFALIGVARADVASEMNGFFNDAGGAANVTGPTAFQGQSAGYYSLGNVWTRFPQKSVSPFNLQLPSARAGCGGIDLFSGSFSFINASEIVAMLKATANNALGFAFKLAIDSVSPEIGKVMDEFSQKAQLLNQMNISSCETAQALVGGIWPQMETTRSTICEAVGNSQGVFSDWAASRQGCNNGGQRDATLAGNTDPAMKEQIIGDPHNYTWEALKKSSKFGAFDQAFSEYVMTLVGTIVTTPPTGSEHGPKVVIYGPAEEAVVTALLDGTANAPAVKILKCNNDPCTDVSDQTLSVPASSALRPRIATMIKSMSSKIRSDSALDAAEKQLLNMATVPIYKILAVQAYAHYALTDGEIQTLSEIVAVDLLNAMLDNMLDRVEQAKVFYQTADQETASQWRQQIAATRAKFAQRDVKLSNKLQVTMQIINRSIMLESTLQNTMTPGMSSALNFSRGLNAQGLL
ncbi:conjugative transfer pilus assembly protein TraH [Sphingomonas trueperi]|jgi:conjugative transfer pilus assembly protein TraH|uniref:Conjugal transfer protein TraH n=3 Tax=Sphingomonadaceae TaxID=41297 RepID=A0A1E1F7X4_9SPHN|nr:conjugative transfer pilus assembly protein TraH [Sphingomonas trueperi]BAV66511.1 conjugal transfer protein TraH [Sphingobium cloacae]